MTVPPDEGPDDVAGLFALERARLLHLLATVGPDQWAEPSPCPGWTDHAWRLLSNNLPAAEQARLRFTGDPAVAEVLRRTRAIIGSPD